MRRAKKNSALATAQDLWHDDSAKAMAKAGRRKMIMKAAAKQIPGIGEIAMAAEGLHSYAKDIPELKEGLRASHRRVRQAARGGRWGEAAEAFAEETARQQIKQGEALTRALVSGATVGEVGEWALPRGKASVSAQLLENRRARANPVARQNFALLHKMIELRLAYQLAHWNAKVYGDHLLFERLYKGLDEDIDTWAELLRGEYNATLPSAPTSLPTDLMRAEQDLETWAGNIVHKGGEDCPRSFENFLLSFIQNRARAIYLLRQRS